MMYLLQVYGLIGVSVALAVFLTYFSLLAGAFLVSGTHRLLKRIKLPSHSLRPMA
jgi:hypothetical protein